MKKILLFSLGVLFVQGLQASARGKIAAKRAAIRSENWQVNPKYVAKIASDEEIELQERHSEQQRKEQLVQEQQAVVHRVKPLPSDINEDFELRTKREKEDAALQWKRTHENVALIAKRFDEDKGWLSRFNPVKKLRRSKQDTQIAFDREKEDKQRAVNRLAEDRAIQRRKMFEMLDRYPKNDNNAFVNRLADLMSDNFYDLGNEYRLNLLTEIKRLLENQQTNPADIGISQEDQEAIFRILMPDLQVTPSDVQTLSDETARVALPTLKELNNKIKKWAAQEADTLITELQQRNSQITKNTPVIDSLLIAAASCILIAYVGVFTFTPIGFVIAAVATVSALGFWTLGVIAKITQYVSRRRKGHNKELAANQKIMDDLRRLFPKTMSTVTQGVAAAAPID